MDTPAIEVLRTRARQGEPRALCELGKRLLLGIGTAAAPQEGYAYLADAAARGDGEASAQLALLAGWGVLRPQSWPEALDHLQRAAELGWVPARRDLRRAQVYRKDAAGYTEAGTRTNSEADYTFGNADLVLRLVIERIAGAVGLPTRHFEVAKLLHYEPGQQFAPHHDFQDPAIPALAREVARRGQRVATVLVYLNDDFEGGETGFPRLGLRHRGATGDALLFANVRPDGAPDQDSLHAGLPTTRGVKWVLSQWIRSRSVDGGA